MELVKSIDPQAATIVLYNLALNEAMQRANSMKKAGSASLVTGRKYLNEQCAYIYQNAKMMLERAQPGRMAALPGMPGYNEANSGVNEENDIDSMSVAFLPLYVMGMLKSPAFKSNNKTVGTGRSSKNSTAVMRLDADFGRLSDQRVGHWARLGTLNCCKTALYYYPRLLRIDGVMDAVNPKNVDGSNPDVAPLGTYMPNSNEIEIGDMLPLTAQSLAVDGAFLLDNGITLTVWLGNQVSPEFLHAVFGANSLNDLYESVPQSNLPPRMLPQQVNQQNYPHTFMSKAEDELLGTEEVVDSQPDGQHDPNAPLPSARDRFKQILQQVREDYQTPYMGLQLTHQGRGDSVEKQFFDHLIEDRCTGMEMTFDEFRKKLMQEVVEL